MRVPDVDPLPLQTSILASHIGFMRGMKRQGISRETLPYKAVSGRPSFTLPFKSLTPSSSPALPTIPQLHRTLLHCHPVRFQGL